MIDSEARKQVAAVTRLFLTEKITSFEFDDALGRIRTDDPTVMTIAHELWHFYDDLKNHKVALTKSEWDYIYRLILILESDADADIEICTVRSWSLRHGVAASALALFTLLAWRVGWGTQLVVLALPFGVLSLLLALWRLLSTPKPTPLELTSAPFVSLPQLLGARRRTPDFAKRNYPNHLAERRIRHPLIALSTEWPSFLALGLAWLMFAPIPLLLQSLPDTGSRLTTKAS